MSIARNILLWASRNRWLARHMPRFPFVIRAARKFIPGERVEDALREAGSLGEQGISTIITFLGENVSDQVEVEAVARNYLETLNLIARNDLDCHISIKLTQFGLDFDRDLCFTTVDRIVNRAADHGNFVWIDMESSEYTDVTVDIFKRLKEKHSNLGICLQAYLYRTGDDLAELLELDSVFRLVKGAYREPGEIAYPKKKDVDENFFTLASMLLKSSRSEELVHSMATHDSALLDRIDQVARDMPQSHSSYEIQILYGIKVEQRGKWVKEGRRVRVLISYGEAWFPWYIRRLAERPANVWFVIRNLFK